MPTKKWRQVNKLRKIITRTNDADGVAMDYGNSGFGRGWFMPKIKDEPKDEPKPKVKPQ